MRPEAQTAVDAEASGGSKLGFVGSFRTAASDLPAARHELEQANIRIVIVALANLYLMLGERLGFVSAEISTVYAWMFSGAFGLSFAIRASFLLLPNASTGRRLFCMLADYGLISATIGLGDEFSSPIYAVLIWVTVGYGMRFGPRYLLASTAASQASVLLIGLLSPFWQQHPFLVGMLSLTALIVPVYANILLRETRRSRDAALAADLAKSRFLAQASHDLRQPIHAISLFTACLREESLSDNQKQMVDSIDRSLASVSRLFRSLLDISMLDSGRIAIQPEPVAVGRLLTEVVDRNRSIQRRVRLVGTRASVRSDRALLETIVQNLVSNALKYAPGRDVLVGCRRQRGTLSIWVVDRGPGIPDAEIENIFTEFYRIPQPGRDLEGIGLGLSIVRRLAHLLDCTVRVSSRPGKGTVFAIEGLSRVRSPRPGRDARLERPLDYEPLAGLKVLLVEDNVQVLRATSLLLQGWGCIVQAEPSPDFATERPDVIVSDFDLDGPISGIDVIDRVRSQTGRAVPALLMTGHDEGRVREALGGRDIPLLQKPLHPIELRAALTGLRRQRTKGAREDSQG
ncbi:ATP-binding response regulator [Aureimonas populi]|uniref:histidine kinase n=1 Tax=Aureimonas populi TaxID=1701758 RepID=A0ABW5CNN8_9HYPH|nr:hybrid sensor histidine kinase/response regulator [Aureimonas populi]